jgi:hypothetical protein
MKPTEGHKRMYARFDCWKRERDIVTTVGGSIDAKADKRDVHTEAQILLGVSTLEEHQLW